MPVMATQWPICKIARPGDRGQARSYRDLYWLADLVGAGLPEMASLRSGGTTGVPEDREQARSYRGLWWLADLVGAGLPAMASLRSGGATGVPADREQARSYRGLWWLAVILWELACQRWHLCGLAERPGCSGSRASSLLQGGVVAGGNFVGAGLPEMASLRSGGTTGVPEDREQARSYRGLWWLADLVGAGLPAMASLRSGGATEVQRIASKLAPTGVCGGWRILWELACQRWHLCDRATSVKP